MSTNLEILHPFEKKEKSACRDFVALYPRRTLDDRPTVVGCMDLAPEYHPGGAQCPAAMRPYSRK
jgi:hypothetical protein